MKTYFVMNLVLFLILAGCSHTGKNTGHEVNLTEEVELRLSGRAGQSDITKYRYHSSKSTFDQRKIRVKRDEIVNFRVQSEVMGLDSNQNIQVRVKTLDKEGPVDLNDLAYPEVDETIHFLMTKDAQVIRAGGYSSDSIFYVQPIPLPGHPVKKGDTWTMRHSWLSRHNGIPLKLDLVAILTKFVSCGSADVCADIELSGNVSLPPNLIRGTLDSKIFGRILFAKKAGMVIWSEIRTDESLKTPEEKVDVVSCMESVIESPKEYQWGGKSTPYCTPNSEFKNQIPQF